MPTYNPPLILTLENNVVSTIIQSNDANNRLPVYPSSNVPDGTVDPILADLVTYTPTLVLTYLCVSQANVTPVVASSTLSITSVGTIDILFSSGDLTALAGSQWRLIIRATYSDGTVYDLQSTFFITVVSAITSFDITTDLTTDLGMVRLFLRDDNPAAPVFSDAQINAFIFAANSFSTPKTTTTMDPTLLYEAISLAFRAVASNAAYLARMVKVELYGIDTVSTYNAIVAESTNYHLMAMKSVLPLSDYINYCFVVPFVQNTPYIGIDYPPTNPFVASYPLAGPIVPSIQFQPQLDAPQLY